MLALDSLVYDLIFGAKTSITQAQLVEALGGEEAAGSLLLLDPDVDAPQIEMEISPTVGLRHRGERRLLIIDESVAPLRRSPQTDFIVPKDLRPARDRLEQLVEKTGARLGRLSAFGSWGEAAIVTRTARDLRAVCLLGWAFDPSVDLEGRRRANPLTQREFESKLTAFDKRLDELDEPTVLGRVPPARLAKKGDLIVVDVLSDRDGSWDLRKSAELESRVSALDLFARILGARVAAAPEERAKARPAEATPAKAAPPPEPPRPVGPPLKAAEVDGHVVLAVPGERFNLDMATALGRSALDALAPGDQVTGAQKDRIAENGCGFVAPLAFLSEVFLEGKPLDKKRFLESSSEAAPGVRVLEAHLPRFGAVRIVEREGKRYVTSETTLPVEKILPLTQLV